jgi:GDP-mannose 6-dehydrogenase
VHLSSLLGANRRYIEQHLPHIGSLIRNDIAEVIAGSDVLVVGLGDTGVVAALAQHTRAEQTIIDLINIADRTALRGEYVGLCW